MRVSSTRRPTLFAALIGASMLALSFGCGGPPTSRSDGQDTASGSQELPQLTKAVIDERINDTRVRDVPPESGTGQPIPWRFDEDEPKEIVVVDQQIDGTRATIVLEIKTQSAPRASTQRYLAGQIRTEWALQTGWVTRRWEIVRTENISMKYRDIPKPTDQNNNRPPVPFTTASQ